MKPVKRAVRNTFVLSLLLTVALAAGIPVIVSGAIYGNNAILAIGIVCAVIGFYGVPVAWSVFGNKRGLSRLVYAVVEEHIYTVSELAAHLSISEKDVRARLTACFQHKYLPGYRRDGDNITLNDGVALGKREFAAECPNCGAKFTYTADRARCPYCNSPVMQNNSSSKNG